MLRSSQKISSLSFFS